MIGQPLWFFWGQPHMSYLRWMTLFSATRVHDDVRLVVRSETQRPEVKWIEKQDFQFETPVADWMPRVIDLPVAVVDIEQIAPEVAALNAPDIQTADLLRLYLLAHFGGTTADMDIVFFRPLPDIAHDVQLARFSGHPQPGYVPIGFMQGRPCAWWHDQYHRALASYNPQEYQSCGAKDFPSDIASALSERVIFPWAGRPWSRWAGWVFVSNNWPAIPDDCIGLHWCASHAQQWNRQYNCDADVRLGAIRWAIDQVDSKPEFRRSEQCD